MYHGIGIDRCTRRLEYVSSRPTKFVRRLITATSTRRIRFSGFSRVRNKTLATGRPGQCAVDKSLLHGRVIIVARSFTPPPRTDTTNCSSTRTLYKSGNGFSTNRRRFRIVFDDGNRYYALLNVRSDEFTAVRIYARVYHRVVDRTLASVYIIIVGVLNAVRRVFREKVKPFAVWYGTSYYLLSVRRNAGEFNNWPSRNRPRVDDRVAAAFIKNGNGRRDGVGRFAFR